MDHLGFLTCQAKEEDLNNFPNMTFHFGSAIYTWPAKGYMFPGPALFLE